MGELRHFGLGEPRQSQKRVLQPKPSPLSVPSTANLPGLLKEYTPAVAEKHLVKEWDKTLGEVGKETSVDTSLSPTIPQQDHTFEKLERLAHRSSLGTHSAPLKRAEDALARVQEA